MGSGRSHHPSAREMVLGGVRFAEEGEFLDAIDLWEQALAAKGGGANEAAYLCIALLEGHLKALHEGRETEFPHFRGRLREIHFPLDDEPTQPYQEQDPFDFGEESQEIEEPSLPNVDLPLALDESPEWNELDAETREFDEFDDAGWETEFEDSGPFTSDPSGRQPKIPTDSRLPVELELPEPLPTSVQLAQITPVKVAVHGNGSLSGPLEDPFAVLRTASRVAELPPPLETAEPDEAVDDPDDDFEIVVDESEVRTNEELLKPWERGDESEIIDLAGAEFLPETDTHQWQDDNPWSSEQKVPPQFEATPFRPHRRTGFGGDLELHELDIPEEVTGQIRVDKLKEAKTHQSLGDYHSSQSVIEEYLENNPDSREIQDLKEENLRQIEMKYLAKLGPMESRPRLAISADQLVWHNLDPNKGFLISRVDGKVSVADLIDIVHLPRLETLRLLAELATDGIIDFK